MHRPKQSKAKAKVCIYIYNPLCFPFHHAEKENSDLWATYSLQQCSLWGRCFPALPLHIQMLCLICSFIFLPVEQCSLNPLFSLWLFGEILLPLPLSCLWVWSHTCQLFRQTGITVLQEHTMTPLPAIFCILIESIFSLSSPANKGESHLLHQCTVEAQQKTTLCCICPKGFLFHGWSRAVVAPFY